MGLKKASKARCRLKRAFRGKCGYAAMKAKQAVAGVALFSLGSILGIASQG
jgi:hypothetical protein